MDFDTSDDLGDDWVPEYDALGRPTIQEREERPSIFADFIAAIENEKRTVKKVLFLLKKIEGNLEKQKYYLETFLELKE
jgi:hypothetical protein